MPQEQRARFAADQQARALRGLPDIGLDPHLLAALDAGLPACAGVALGFDRVVMLAAGRHAASTRCWRSRGSAPEEPQTGDSPARSVSSRLCHRLANWRPA